MKTPIEYCHECVKYKLTCDGKNLFKKGRDGILCATKDSGAYVIPSRIQIDAFMLAMKIKRANNVSPLLAFVEAIVETSDDRFAEAKKYRKNKVDKYVELNKYERN